MERSEIIERLTAIFKDILDDDDIALTEQTTANEVEDWDSLNHIHLIVAFEEQFDIRFTSSEIQHWSNVGSIVDSISGKL